MKQKWTPTEDEKLFWAYKKFPRRWGKISTLMNDRNASQCAQRFRRKFFLQKKMRKWSENEDRELINLVNEHGRNWQKLSALGNFDRNGKQLRERYLNVLDPSIKKEKWTDEEDKILIQKFNEYGNKWSKISIFLSGRPENTIKNRFYSYIKKVIANNGKARKKENNCFFEAELRSENYIFEEYLYKLTKNEESDVLTLKPNFSSNSVKENFVENYCSLLPEDILETDLMTSEESF